MIYVISIAKINCGKTLMACEHEDVYCGFLTFRCSYVALS